MIDHIIIKSCIHIKIKIFGNFVFNMYLLISFLNYFDEPKPIVVLCVMLPVSTLLLYKRKYLYNYIGHHRNTEPNMCTKVRKLYKNVFQKTFNDNIIIIVCTL